LPKSRSIRRSFRTSSAALYVEAMIEPDGWRYVGDGWSGRDFERGQRAKDRLEVKQSVAHTRP
jgi:hypothetical protein